MSGDLIDMSDLPGGAAVFSSSASSDRPAVPIGRAVVVGAGVSGCACAARLAEQQVEVILVSSALDVVGIPGYGPEMWAGTGGWEEICAALAGLPRELRRAWLNTASVPGSGEPVLIVDRRAVSIESKLALDRSPMVRFRQGLVEELRFSEIPGPEASGEQTSIRGGGATAAVGPSEQGSLEVETAFGEVFRGDCVVLAPGLALRGRSQVGEEEMPGGRRGEVPADRLCDVLEGLGAGLAEASLEVGPRYAAQSEVIIGGFGRHRGMRVAAQIPVRVLLASQGAGAGQGQGGGAVPALGNTDLEGPFTALAEMLLTSGPSCSGAIAGELGEWEWPVDFPPAPHYPEEPSVGAMMIEVQGGSAGATGAATGATEDGRPPGLVALDGAATAEYYLSPGITLWGDDEPPREGLVRPGYSVRASVVKDVLETGSIVVPGLVGAEGRIKVIGRAAGAQTYLESLQSAIAAADDVARLLRSRRPW